MKKSIKHRWLAFSLFVAGMNAGLAANPVNFQSLLDEAGLLYSKPSGFQDRPAERNEQMPFEHALRSTDNNLEIHYAVRPLSRLRIDYDDAHNPAPMPDHLFNLLFETLTERLANGGNALRREYPSEQARKLFNADWAAASVFDTDAKLSSGYSQALLIAIHKSGKADAYMLYLFNHYPAVKQSINSALSSLAFSR